MLLRFDPFRELDRFSEQFEQLASGAAAPALPMDAVHRDGTVEVRFDLPGFDRDSIDLEVDRNVLTLRAQRHWTPAEGEQVIVHERRSGQFTRQLLLGDTLDGGNVQADYRDGVLTVSIPVAETAKPRKVSISGSDEAPALDVTESNGQPDGDRELTSA
jgi:HSP20 family protein